MCGNDLTLIFRLALASDQFLTMVHLWNDRDFNLPAYFLLQYTLTFFFGKRHLEEEKIEEFQCHRVLSWMAGLWCQCFTSSGLIWKFHVQINVVYLLLDGDS